jgi:hypothetical protein
MRKGAEMIGVRVAVHEVALQRQVKMAGGRWNPAYRVWELRRDQALQLGLKDRIEHAKVSISRRFPRSEMLQQSGMRLRSFYPENRMTCDGRVDRFILLRW